MPLRGTRPSRSALVLLAEISGGRAPAHNGRRTECRAPAFRSFSNRDPRDGWQADRLAMSVPDRSCFLRHIRTDALAPSSLGTFQGHHGAPLDRRLVNLREPSCGSSRLQKSEVPKDRGVKRGERRSVQTIERTTLSLFSSLFHIFTLSRTPLSTPLVCVRARGG